MKIVPKGVVWGPKDEPPKGPFPLGQWVIGAIVTFFLLAALGSCSENAHAAIPVAATTTQ